MTLGNAKVLYKHFKSKGMEVAAAQLERRFPELIGTYEEESSEASQTEEKPELEAKVEDDEEVPEKKPKQPKKKGKKK